MFRLYSKENVVHPYVGILSAVALLGLAMLMALAVQRQKLATWDVPLGAPVRIEGTPFSFRIPEGWQPVRKQEDGKRILAEFQGGGDARERYELSVVFGDLLGSMAQWRFFREISEGPMGNHSRLEMTRLGPLAAIQLSIGQRAHRLAYTPDGRPVSLTLGTTLRSNSQAQRVLNKIAGSAEWFGPTLADTPADLEASTGLRFEIESPAVFQADSLGATGHLHAAAGAEADTIWWLDAWHSPLLGDRTAGDLMEDRMLQLGTKGVPKVTKVRENRAAWRYRMNRDDHLLEFWVIEVDEDNAVVLRLNMQPPTEMLADEIFRSVSESLKIVPVEGAIGVSEARSNALRFVEALQTDGLSHWWSTQTTRNLYVGWQGDHPVQWITETRKPLEAEGGGFDVTQLYQTRSSEGKLVTRAMHWQLDEQGRPFPLDSNAPKTILGSGALDVALFLAARSRRTQDLVFVAAESGEPTRWQAVFAQILESRLSSESGKREYLIRIREDCSPISRILVFNETGDLIREEHPAITFRLSDEQEFQRSHRLRLMELRTRR